MESQPSPYPPPAVPPAQPEKKSKVWLWIVIGLVVVCIGCVAVFGVLSLVGVNLFSQVAATAMPELEQMATDLPQQIATQMPADDLVPSPYVMEIVMAKDVEGENLNPVDPTSNFEPGSTFHAVVAIEDAPADTTFEAIWYAEDVGGVVEPNTLINQTELTAEGTRNLDFTLTPDSVWPAGRYRVEVWVDDEKSHIATFFVVE